MTYENPFALVNTYYPDDSYVSDTTAVRIDDKRIYFGHF